MIGKGFYSKLFKSFSEPVIPVGKLAHWQQNPLLEEGADLRFSTPTIIVAFLSLTQQQSGVLVTKMYIRYMKSNMKNTLDGVYAAHGHDAAHIKDKIENKIQNSSKICISNNKTDGTNELESYSHSLVVKPLPDTTPGSVPWVIFHWQHYDSLLGDTYLFCAPGNSSFVHILCI